MPNLDGDKSNLKCKNKITFFQYWAIQIEQIKLSYNCRILKCNNTWNKCAKQHIYLCAYFKSLKNIIWVLDVIVQQIGCTSVRNARYTSTGKIPVSIIFQTVRYQNWSHYGISYAAVTKFTCSASQIAVQPGVKCDNRTTWWIKQIKLLTCPKLTNKENSRSEIWHYFSYKTDDKGERTDHRRQDIKSC